VNRREFASIVTAAATIAILPEEKGDLVAWLDDTTGRTFQCHCGAWCPTDAECERLGVFSRWMVEHMPHTSGFCREDRRDPRSEVWGVAPHGELSRYLVNMENHRVLALA